MQDQGVDSSRPDEILEEAKTVDDAIEKGLARLGVGADAVEIKVLNEGSKPLSTYQKNHYSHTLEPPL